MAVNLKKGDKVNLTKDNPGLTNVLAGLSWDVKQFDTGADFDLDAVAFLVTKDGVCKEETDFIFFNNKTDKVKSVQYMGDNRTGAGDGDDEQIKTLLHKVPEHVEKIVYAIVIYDAAEKNQNFGQVPNAAINIYNGDTGEHLVEYDLDEEFSIETAVVVGELYRYKGEWKFNPVGSGFEGGLEALCEHYGLDV